MRMELGRVSVLRLLHLQELQKLFFWNLVGLLHCLPSFFFS